MPCHDSKERKEEAYLKVLMSCMFHVFSPSFSPPDPWPPSHHLETPNLNLKLMESQRYMLVMLYIEKKDY